MTDLIARATVVVLTYNGEKYLGRILDALAGQKFSKAFEILVIDSGSTDTTLEIVSQHPGVRLHEIPNSEFGHGRTRNLGARLAKGSIVVYLTHDAIPIGRGWLEAMVEPFDDPEVVAVLGRQVARPDAPPIIKYEIERTFLRQGEPGQVTKYRGDFAPGSRDEAIATFYSDSASAARRETLLGEIPYPEVDYAEDQLFCRAVIASGRAKAYAGGAVVEHSNDLGLRELGARVQADVLGLRTSGTEVARTSVLNATLKWVKWASVDFGRILTDPDLSIPSKLKWAVLNPIYHVVKWSNYRRATIAELVLVEKSGSED
ncbi:MAG: glycosyltransferase family 2 protein [Cryobacterium sp.]|nr:glycosyltransferase family 2 protein [Cryobacterium sp.]MCO5294623.1 glycosyltransferase family 2 protein [Homoserinimonas sp.]